MDLDWIDNPKKMDLATACARLVATSEIKKKAEYLLYSHCSTIKIISNYNISYFSIKLNKELNRLDAVKKININIKKEKTEFYSYLIKLIHLKLT